MPDDDDVPEFIIWGSGLNERTGMVTLFLVRREHLETLHSTGALGQDDQPTPAQLFDETDAAIELNHDQLHFAIDNLGEMHDRLQRWEDERAARAKFN